MKLKNMLWVLVFIVLIANVMANAGHSHSSFEQTEAIINAEIPCNDLSEEQLEFIGDYYMEKMHPGEAHETMDDMMGGEGSAQLKQTHINMAKKFYCKEDIGVFGAGIMGMMQGGNTMMGTGYGMMGLSGGYWNFFSILYIILVVGLVILVYLWIYKLWKNIKKK